MPGKRKITIETLTELGAHKLAQLLIAEAAGNRQLKQAIDLAISAKEGPVVLGATLKHHDVRCWEKSRKLVLALSFSVFDPKQTSAHWKGGRRLRDACHPTVDLCPKRNKIDRLG
jgi:hypothetical protein